MKKTLTRTFCTLLVLLASASVLAASPIAGSWTENDQKFGLFNVYVYLPKNAKPALAGKRAMMVVLHGCKQTVWGDIRDNRAGWEGVAEQFGMVIAAPDVPDTNATGTRLFAGCWDWFGTAHKRGERDIALLADMIKGLSARADLKIDPAQVYVVGLSSGAAVGHILACAYPELVAGVGLHSTPALGSNVMDSFGPPKVSVESAVDLCKQYAGEQQAAFSTQVASIIQGSEDLMVHFTHADRNREVFQQLYGATHEAGKIAETNKSNGMLYKDGAGKLRLGLIHVEGLGHAFSAGSGGSGGGQFHNYQHINYPAWVTRFFFDNNLRVKR